MSQRQGSPLLCKVCFDVIPLNDLPKSTELERHLCIKWKKQLDLLSNKAITQHFPWNVIVLHTCKRYTSLLGNKQGSFQTWKSRMLFHKCLINCVYFNVFSTESLYSKVYGLC